MGIPPITHAHTHWRRHRSPFWALFFGDMVLCFRRDKTLVINCFKSKLFDVSLYRCPSLAWASIRLGYPFGYVTLRSLSPSGVNSENGRIVWNRCHIFAWADGFEQWQEDSNVNPGLRNPEAVLISEKIVSGWEGYGRKIYILNWFLPRA